VWRHFFLPVSINVCNPLKREELRAMEYLRKATFCISVGQDQGED
jgi:hypothetical protein